MRRFFTRFCLTACLLGLAALSVSAAESTRLAGQVRNPKGEPVVGAHVWVVQRSARGKPFRKLKTDREGQFKLESLRPGVYAVRVSMEAFRPEVEESLRLKAGEDRWLDIRLQPEPQIGALSQEERERQDWLWVLRTRASVRSILRFGPEPQRSPGEEVAKDVRGSVSVSSFSGPRSDLFSDGLATKFAFEVPLELPGRFQVAGGTTHPGAPGAAVEARWSPEGWEEGPQLSLAVRQQFLPSDHPDRTAHSVSQFRTVRASVASRAALPADLSMDYRLEMVNAEMGGTARALLPYVRLERPLTGSTTLRYAFSTAPGGRQAEADRDEKRENPPAGPEPRSLRVSRRAGRLRIERHNHHEVGVEQRMGFASRWVAVAFFDRVQDAVLTGRGNLTALNAEEFLTDLAGSSVHYDAGAYSNRGFRVAYVTAWMDGMETMVGYVYGKGLAVRESEAVAGRSLREQLETRPAHALSARVAATLPGSLTRLSLTYQWLSESLLTEVYAGEDAVAPYLSLAVIQPLPSFFFIPEGLALRANVRNLLEEGTVEVATTDGTRLRLAPIHRSFRGGVSYQF